MNLPRQTGQDGDPPVQSPRSHTTKIVAVMTVLAIVVGVVVLHVTGLIHGH